ncbi:MAG: hypothetical protein GQ531_11165 [Sulfurovum sp.]|nr:hypothetical protein [Sulfurovum sp.]
MKKIVLVLITLSMCLQADLSVKQIQEMVNKIHEKRAGVELETLKETKEPFVHVIVDNNVSTLVVPTVTAKEDKLILHAIVNGKAYINDAWLTLDDKILGYDLKFIGKRGVVLRNENHIKKLFLRKKRDSFIKLEER